VSWACLVGFAIRGQLSVSSLQVAFKEWGRRDIAKIEWEQEML